MIRAWLAAGMMFLSVSVIEGQETIPPVAPKPALPIEGRVLPGSNVAQANPAASADFEFVIEMMLLEGKDLFGDDAASRDLTAGDSFVERIRSSTRRLGEQTPTVSPAAHPVPPPAARRVGDPEQSNATPVPPAAHPAAPSPAPVPHPVAAYLSETTKNSGVDELWDGRAIDSPGVTKVACPRITTLTRQLVPLQIQTSSFFSYLVPLGYDKYQAKRTPKQELGMKITFAVQTVDGDDSFVELSPLEIQITALDGREPVEGLDLEVGKPIISTRSLKTTAKMKLGATRLIAIPSGPKTQAALLLRVKRPSIEYKGTIEFRTTIMQKDSDGILETQQKK